MKTQDTFSGWNFTTPWIVLADSYPTLAPYAITSTAGSNGSLSPSGATRLASHGSQTFTITPSTGYSISDVLVDGVSVGAVSTYTFTNAIADHTISATFVADTQALAQAAPSAGPTAVSVPNLSYAELRAIFGDRAQQPAYQPAYPLPYQPAPFNNGISGIAPILRTYMPGRRSPEIQSIQKILNADPATRVSQAGAGSPGRETDFYGPATRAAVQKFQLKHGVVASPRDPGYGIVGPKTRAKLNELLGKR